jgi:hypothetical protein
MKRGLTALAGALLVLSSLPGAVGAAKVSKYSDHIVSVSCEQPVDGGYVSTYVESSQQTGGFASIDFWLDPAIPFQDPSSATGVSDSPTVTEGAGGADVSVSWDVTDPDGNPAGTATLSASLTNVGAPYSDPSFASGNHHSSTVITHQDMQGSATISVLGAEYTVDCFGTVTDLDVFENNPTSFVSDDAGFQLDCFWQDGDTVASVYAINDDFDFFVNAFLQTSEGVMSGSAFSGTFDATSIDATVPLTDDFGNSSGTATVSASLTPVGSLITAFLIQHHVRTKLVMQKLAADGSVDFSTGQSFALDADHCDIEAFSNHTVSSAPSGPKPGPAPINDGPDGAIAVAVGSTVRADTTGTVVPPEVPITTCPQGISDDFGHTVWYTFTGTGDPVTIDTSGSNFDTLVGVYTRDGDSWNEVGCEDDQGNPANPISYQAKLTISTEAGVTYYVQAGGFRRFFDPDNAQSGRLRLAIG